MNVNDLSESDFNEIVDRVIDVYVQYCQEILYDQDQFLYKKISALHRSDKYEMKVALYNTDDVKESLDYYEELSPNYYVAMVGFVDEGQDAPAAQQDLSIEVARLVLSTEKGDESYVEFLLS